MDKLCIDANVVKELYIKACKNKDFNSIQLLESIYGTAPFKEIATQKIKTYQDAFDYLGKNHPLIKEVEHQGYTTNEMRIMILCRALNNNWLPEFKENEERYYPSFTTLNKWEFDNLKPKEKESCFKVNENCYFKYCTVIYNTKVISNNPYICFKNAGYCIYCAQAFLPYWVCYYFGDKKYLYSDEYNRYMKWYENSLVE